MWKGTLVGAVALATGMLISSAQAQTLGSFEQGQGNNHIGVTVKEAHITRLKAVLNLTPQQRPYWAPVEAALREIARQSREEASAGGIVQRMSDRASSVAGDAMRLRRLVVAARPLIRVLDDGQKHEAMALARQYGFDRLVAAL